MAQENNHIMQSYTDVLAVNDGGHEYYGIAPIHVDNLTDNISIDPAVLHAYSGVSPVNVDLVNDTISIDNIQLNLEYPLSGTLSDDTFTIGCEQNYGTIDDKAITGFSIDYNSAASKLTVATVSGDYEIGVIKNSTYPTTNTQEFYYYNTPINYYTDIAPTEETIDIYSGWCHKLHNCITISPKCSFEGVLTFQNLDMGSNSGTDGYIIMTNVNNQVINSKYLNYDWYGTIGNADKSIQLYYRNPTNSNLYLHSYLFHPGVSGETSNIIVRCNGKMEGL